MATILVVDDHPSNRDYLGTLLRYRAHKVLEAADGAGALDLARAEHPDLIIADVVMPVMDGFEFARQLRSDPATAGIPLVFYTATYLVEEAQSLALSCGVSDVIVKPGEPDKILQMVAKILEDATSISCIAAEEFDRRHQQLLMDKLAAQVDILEQEVARREQVEQVARDYAQRLQALSRQLMKAQETERSRIARELHDEIGQAMTTVRLYLQSAQRLSDPAAIGVQLQESIAVIDQGIQRVRGLLADLRPPLLDEIGLAKALKMYVERQAGRAGWQARCHAQLPPAGLPATLELTCFRVVQEALTNVARHARAASVVVELKLAGEDVQLTVKDDGTGFTPGAADSRRGNHLGLLGMQERVLLAGGRMAIESAPGQGTEIRVYLPLSDLPQGSPPVGQEGVRS